MTPILTVSEITRIIKHIFDSNDILRQVYIKGEISNFKHHASGHMYFTLKDAKSQIHCIMFKNSNRMLTFYPENGMKVIGLGGVGVYERSGEYQLYIEDLVPDGIGALNLAFEQLKEKLEKEGLFDSKRKKTIPYLPRKIGLITSLTGAAIRDMLTVIRRRFPNVDIIIAPSQVQGRTAADEICSALQSLNDVEYIDVIILGRGGGSLEELWVFNEEKVARAISNSKVPVISAVGHETDFTISDFVADKRAPTPSAAGEIVVPEKDALLNAIKQYKSRIIYAFHGIINIKRQKLEYIRRSVAFTRSKNYIFNYRLSLDRILKKLLKEIYILEDNKKVSFNNQIMKLQALNPLAILERGYSICQFSESNKIIKKIKDVNAGDLIKVILSDGNLTCCVKSEERRNGCNEAKI